MTHAARVLVENLDLLNQLSTRYGVLDLACGCGRNGLALAKLGIPVIFADSDQEKLGAISRRLEQEKLPGRTWLVDLENAESDPLAQMEVDACLVFNYLYRPGVKSIRDMITPGGLIYYETFTKDNRQFGRPNNPDYLLHPNELKNAFKGWEILHYFEGELSIPARAVANIIARKP
jgi:SAM-dependent methyltransferase